MWVCGQLAAGSRWLCGESSSGDNGNGNGSAVTVLVVVAVARDQSRFSSLESKRV